MDEAKADGAAFRISGPAGAAAPARARARLEERIARGVLSEREIERVTNARLLTLDSGGGVSEAFRRCCTAFEADRPAPITSHRPVVGPVIVAVKKLVRRALRFQHEAALARQSEFNRNLLLVLRDLLERTERRREP
ncbi:MAG: hypothetical protein ACREQ9_19180 [Candidatus Binatia bacterium]